MLRKRQIINEIERYIFDDEIIVLHGARQVGKTSILLYLMNFLRLEKHITAYVDLEDSRFLEILNGGDSDFVNYLREEGFDLNKKVFVFIDEIQYLKNPSNFLKLIHDHHKNIKLIVSGSSSFEIKNKFQDSLVGRTVNFEIFPLNFEEFIEFKGFKFIKNTVYTVKKIEELNKLVKEFVLFGGYPKIVLTDAIEKKEKLLQQIIDTYIRKDIKDLANIKNIDKFNKLIEILSEQSGNILNVQEIASLTGLARQTIESYLFILENTYVIKLVKPFHKNLRSELFRMPKIFFYDTGIQQMLWLKSLQKEVLGSVFETAVFSELVKKYAKENIFYWRTKDQKEIDFILNVKNQIMPIEVKLNSISANKKHIEFFLTKYKIDKYKIIDLKSQKDHFWEI